MNLIKKFQKIFGEKKTENITKEGIDATEKFQNIFFHLTDNIEKVPTSIKNLFLSNFIYRVIAHQYFHTIDEKSANFFKEKIRSKIEEIQADPIIYKYVDLEPNHVKRSRSIGLEIQNTEYADCDVFVMVNTFSTYTPNIIPLHTIRVLASTTTQLQFDIYFSECYLSIKSIGYPTKIKTRINYLPI